MASDDEDNKKDRGRRTPTFPLNEAVGFLGIIQDSLGDGPFSREAIASALGYKAVSGSVTVKVGTLTHYGLLDRDVSAYRISACAKNILFPQSEDERQIAICESAKKPNVFGELVRDFDGKGIPSLFSNVLIHRYGILPSVASEVDKVFRQTMEFAGLFRNGVLHAEIQPATSSEIGKKEPSPTDKEQCGTGGEKPLELKGDQYRIPLTGRRSAILSLPLPLDISDIDRITKWLDLMSDVLTTDSIN